MMYVRRKRIGTLSRGRRSDYSPLAEEYARYPATWSGFVFQYAVCEPGSGPVRISVIIPAWNEEARLTGCLDTVNASTRYAAVDVLVIVVLNRCTDRTELIAVEFRLHHPRQRIARDLEHPRRRRAAHRRKRGLGTDRRIESPRAGGPELFLQLAANPPPESIGVVDRRILLCPRPDNAAAGGPPEPARNRRTGF